MKKIDQKGFSALDIILGIALIAVIGVAGYFAYQNFQSKPSASISTSLSPTPKPTAPVADKYAGWKTYTSSRDGYSIKYSPSWIVVPESASDDPYIRNFDPNSKPKSGSGYPEGYINLRVLVEKDNADYKARTGMSAAAWYSALGTKNLTDGPASYASTDVKSAKVNNLDAKSAKSVATETDEVIFILHNGSLYKINLYPYGSSSEATVKQMLDSFEIL